MRDKELVDGTYLGACGCPKHGSSDSLGLYEKVIDGKTVVDGHCWSECGFISTQELQDLGVIDEDCKVIVEFATKSYSKPFVMTEEVRRKVEEVKNYEIRGWKERRIPVVTSEFYEVRTCFDEDGNVTHRYYPSTENGEIVGWHVRDDLVKQAKNRGEKTDKPPFYSIGKVKSDCELFGQAKFNKGGKYLVLASGEEDAQAIFTALNVEKVGGKSVLKKYITPVVSTTVGEAALKQIKNNYDFITSFDNVIIMYDNDKAGKEGAEKVAKILFAGQAKIASYRRKDACEHSSHGEFKEIVKAFWEAEQYSPVDVLHLNQMWEDFENEDSNVKIPFPDSWSTLNEMLGGGMERGEVTVIGALTSIGKSTMVNNIAYHLVENTPFKVGAMYLETTKREVVRDMLSLDLGINLRKADRSTIDMGILKRRFFDNLVKRDKFVYVDHNGMLTNEKVFDKFNYLAKVEGCDVIIFDPIQAGVNSSDNGAIIEFMDAVLKFAKETDTCVILVSHMRKPDGEDPHAVSEYHLLGSSAINQIAFNTILLSRDKMHESKIVKNSTKIRLVKCRRTGETGNAGWLRYDDETTHLHSSTDPYESLEELDIKEFIGDNPALDFDDNDFNSSVLTNEGEQWEVVET
jgi:twinkle protein